MTEGTQQPWSGQPPPYNREQPHGQPQQGPYGQPPQYGAGQPPYGYGQPPPGYLPPGSYPPAPPPPKKSGIGGRLAIAGAVIAVLLILIGISGRSGSSNTPTTNNYGSTPTISVAPTATSQPAPDPPATTAAFGTPITYQDGLSVGVTQPTRFTPSGTAAGNTGVSALVVTVTVANGTTRPIEASTIYLTTTMAGQPADNIFDSAKGLNGPPNSTIQPGRSITFRQGFSTAAQNGDVQVDVRPGYSYDPATFTGSI